jgi:hypothetical protein
MKTTTEMLDAYDTLAVKAKKLEGIAIKLEKLAENIVDMARPFRKMSEALHTHADEILKAVEVKAKEAGNKFGIKV